MNSLDFVKPYLVKEWSVYNNKKVTEVFPNSNKKAYWDCRKCKRYFKASPNERFKGDSCCPYCSGRKCLAGFNTIDTTHPELIKEWDYLNNMLLADPTQLMETSRIKVWWICQNNPEHRYKLPINKRILFEKRGRVPCSICKGLRRKREHYAQYKK